MSIRKINPCSVCDNELNMSNTRHECEEIEAESNEGGSLGGRSDDNRPSITGKHYVESVDDDNSFCSATSSHPTYRHELTYNDSTQLCHNISMYNASFRKQLFAAEIDENKTMYNKGHEEINFEQIGEFFNDIKTPQMTNHTASGVINCISATDNSSCVKHAMPYCLTNHMYHVGHIRHVVWKNTYSWNDLPVVLLQDIFVLLTYKQRHQASMVCRSWYYAFYSAKVWETFVLLGATLTRRRFNLCKGYQREICPRKSQMCFTRVGHFFKRLIVTAISDYYNLYEFLRLLNAYLTRHEDYPLPSLCTFRFTFACESRGMNGTLIIGTGGNILDKLKELISGMQHLRHFALNQLLLEVTEVPGLLSAVANHNAESLRYLEILNCSKIPFPITDVASFRQLQTLKLSPQSLNEQLVIMIGGTQICQLHIIQDAYTCACNPVPAKVWQQFKETSPRKRVFLEIEGRTKTPLIVQPHAPVKGIVFRSPYHFLEPELTACIIEHYAGDLEIFSQEGLPRFHGSRSFEYRGDESFLRLVSCCPNLHTLVIRQRVSLATMILIAEDGNMLKTFVVRKNALLKKCEWKRSSKWSIAFYNRLRCIGRDYDIAFKEMNRLLDRKWKPCLDKDFKHLRIAIS